MKLYNSFSIKKNHKNSIILIGNFDGLHLGHQKLFRLAKKYKKKYSSKIGVLTFEPMPKMFFNSNLKNFRLSNSCRFSTSFANSELRCNKAYTLCSRWLWAS